MSKHHHKECCCSPMMGGSMMGGSMYGMGGYGGGGYSVGAGGGGYAGASWGIRWIYALLILIVIVLQFGRKDRFCGRTGNVGCDGEIATAKDEIAVAGFGGFFGNNCDNEVIDRSVLFIIVVFLLILCGGCWWGGYGGGGCGGGFGGGYGY